jgi:hypothetical protein
MNDLIKINEIYILCPANHKTGGTELLHQLANELSENGKKVYIAYYFEGKKANKENPTPDAFKQYDFIACTEKEIPNTSDVLLIVPEVCIGKIKKHSKCKSAIWWLSVDNFYKHESIKAISKNFGLKSAIKHIFIGDLYNNELLYKVDYHFYQSYYARDFLLSKGINNNKIFYLSDYINDIYLTISSNPDKEDIVLYNPKKGFEFTSKLMEYDKTIKWVPIINMTNEQVRNIMCKAKVYIDFGNHPGKDRIPREAAICGCCIITGMNGSAKFKEDVPIPNVYKFDSTNDNIECIVKQIHNIMNNYDKISKDFTDYKKFISNEKKTFKNDVKKYFVG